MRYITQYTHYIRAIKQTMLDRSQEVCNPLFSLFSPGSLSQGDTSICAEQLTTTCWVYWKGGRVRWQRDYLDTDLLIWLILSHNHYDKFSWHDSSWIWVWASYKKHFETKINRAWRRHDMETFSTSLVLCEGNPPVTGYVTWCFSHVRPKELFSKHSNGRWSGTPWRSCDISGMEFCIIY